MREENGEREVLLEAALSGKSPLERDLGRTEDRLSKHSGQTLEEQFETHSPPSETHLQPGGSRFKLDPPEPPGSVRIWQGFTGRRQ